MFDKSIAEAIKLVKIDDLHAWIKIVKALWSRAAVNTVIYNRL
jgi:hypothetical protein